MMLDRFTDSDYTAIWIDVSPKGQEMTDINGLILEKLKIKFEFIPEYREGSWFVTVCLPVNHKGFKRVDYLGTTYYAISGSRKIANLVEGNEDVSILQKIEQSKDLSVRTLEENFEDLLKACDAIVMTLKESVPKSAVWIPPINQQVFYESRLRHLKK